MNSQEAIRKLIFDGVRANAIKVVANITSRQYREIADGKKSFTIQQIARLNEAYGIEIEFSKGK